MVLRCHYQAFVKGNLVRKMEYLVKDVGNYPILLMPHLPTKLQISISINFGNFLSQSIVHTLCFVFVKPATFLFYFCKHYDLIVSA